jgi:recombination protein RecT
MSDLTRQTQQAQQRQQQQEDAGTALVRSVYAQQDEVAKALGDGIGPERFLRAMATEIRTVEHLSECTRESVLGSLYVAAQMGLEVGKERGLVWLIPRRNNKKPGNPYEASLQVGYKGWVDLFYRAGAKAVQWFLIRDGDQFRIGSDAIRGKTYEWVQADPNSTRRVTGAVAQVVTATGGVVWEYLSRAEIEKRSTDTTFWRNWWEEMALKTVLHRLAATAPLSDQLVLAQRADETVQRRVPGVEHPVAEHLPLVATPSPKPAPPVQQAQQARPAEPQQQPVDDQRSQYVQDTDPDWEETQRLEAEEYLAEQERLAQDAAAEGDR